MQRLMIIFLLITIVGWRSAYTQEYVSASSPVPGKAPGLKVKLISNAGDTRTYAVIFAPGDEVLSGLTDFAKKYSVKSAHFTAIGDAVSASFGWYDSTKKKFKVNRLSQPAEVTSFVGNIAVNNDTPVVHGHINLATADGMVHGGHLLEAYVGPTLEVMITVEPVALQKRRDATFGVSLIDPAK